MKPLNKTVLFSRVTVNKSVHQWPIAVFPNPVAAKTYAAYIKMAHSAGDIETAKRLDPKTRLDESGALIPGIKFSVTELTYDPSAVAPLADDDLIESPATS